MKGGATRVRCRSGALNTSSAGTERSGYPRRMRADLLRRAGQAITVLSAVVIAYATLKPNVSTDFADDTILHFLLFMPLGAGGALWMAQLEPALQKRAGIAILGLILFFAAATELAQSLVDGQIGRASCRERVCQYV